MSITSKQRAYLKKLANDMDAIFQVGKNSITPEFTNAVSEALEKKELIKISSYKNPIGFESFSLLSSILCSICCICS